MKSLENIKTLKEILYKKGFDYINIYPVYEKDWDGKSKEPGQWLLIGFHEKLGKTEITISSKFFKINSSKKFKSFKEVCTFLEIQ